MTDRHPATPATPGPASAADPTLHPLEMTELPSTPDLGRPVVDPASNPLHQIKTRLQVCVGEVALTVGELLQARENQVLVLDRGVAQPVDVLLEGRVVARGELVAVDDQFAVRITELPLPLKP